MSSAPFNVLSTTAVDLQQLLANKQITSVQIVRQYFDQIDRHEPFLNAFISQAPRDKVLRVAAALDEERSNGSVRSAFHGIPIVLKVSTSMTGRGLIYTPETYKKTGLLHDCFQPRHGHNCRIMGVCRQQSVQELCHRAVVD